MKYIAYAIVYSLIFTLFLVGLTFYSIIIIVWNCKLNPVTRKNNYIKETLYDDWKDLLIDGNPITSMKHHFRKE